jgi:hypothetical protein
MKKRKKAAGKQERKKPNCFLFAFFVVLSSFSLDTNSALSPCFALSRRLVESETGTEGPARESFLFVFRFLSRRGEESPVLLLPIPGKLLEVFLPLKEELE